MMMVTMPTYGRNLRKQSAAQGTCLRRVKGQCRVKHIMPWCTHTMPGRDCSSSSGQSCCLAWLAHCRTHGLDPCTAGDHGGLLNHSRHVSTHTRVAL